MLPLFAPGYFLKAHDARHSIFFLVEFDRSFSEGALWPVWGPDHAVGFGYPTFLLYAPLAFYVGEAFHLLGLGFAAATKATWALGFLLGAAGSYRLGAALVQPCRCARRQPCLHLRALPPVADLRARGAGRVHGARLAALDRPGVPQAVGRRRGRAGPRSPRSRWPRSCSSTPSQRLTFVPLVAALLVAPPAGRSPRGAQAASRACVRLGRLDARRAGRCGAALVHLLRPDALGARRRRPMAVGQGDLQLPACTSSIRANSCCRPGATASRSRARTMG